MLKVRLGNVIKYATMHPDLFNDIWNYFPHNKLGGKSPYEMFKKRYG